MKNIGKIFLRDIKNIFTNSMAIILAVGIAVLPSLYAWFNIYANWDPYGATGNMQVAVVIEDEGFRFHDIDIDVGAQIEANLKANDAIDWQFVSKTEAMEGIESGKYYAGIEIPAGFSESLTSIATSDFKQPQITYYANEKKNAIATKITDKVVQTVQQEVNESFVTTVINVVGSLIDVVADATQSGAMDTFNDLQSKIDAASDTITSVQKTVDSFQDVITLSKTLSDAVNDNHLNEVMNSTTELLACGTDMTKLLQSSIDGITTSVDTVLSQTTVTLDETAALIDGISNKSAADAAEPIAEARAKLLELKARLTTVKDTLENVKTYLPIELPAIDEAIAKLDKRMAEIDTVVGMLDQAASGATQAEVKKITDAISNLGGDLTTIRNDYKTDIQPVINENLSALLELLRVTGDFVSDLNGDMPALQALTAGIDSSVQSGEEIISSVDSLLSGIKKQLDSLSDKIEGLGESEILNTLQNMSATNSEQLGAFLACPVLIETDKVYSIENYGTAMAPFYSTLAIWVGSVILIAVVKTAIKRKSEIGERVGTTQGYFGRMLTFLAFSVVQALIICLGDLYFLKIQCLHPAKFIFAGIVAAIAFTVFIYSLAYTFGDIGKAIVIICLVIQIGGSGGTFPIDVTPNFFQTLNPYMPFTFVINAMRECVCGTYANDYWIDLLKLCAYIGVGLVVGIGVKFLVKKPSRFFEKRIEKTGLF